MPRNYAPAGLGSNSAMNKITGLCNGLQTTTMHVAFWTPQIKCDKICIAYPLLAWIHCMS